MFRVGVDLDGVMCDMLSPLIVLYNQEHGTNLTVNDITDWVLPEGAFEIFSQTEGFFRDLKPIEGAIEGVNKLSLVYEVFFVTCAANIPRIAHDKMIWWINHNLTSIPLIIAGKKYLLELDLLIDDAPHHAEQFVGSSDTKKVILVDALYNQEVETGDESRIYRSTSWEDTVRQCLTLL